MAGRFGLIVGIPGLVLALILTMSTDGSAQQRQPHYRRTPTISPYAQLFQRNQGGVNSYFFDVRPNLELREQMNRMRTAENRGNAFNQQLIQQQTVLLGDEIQQSLRQLTPRQATSGEPAIAARFMDTSDYFPRTSTRTRQ